MAYIRKLQINNSPARVKLTHSPENQRLHAGFPALLSRLFSFLLAAYIDIITITLKKNQTVFAEGKCQKNNFEPDIYTAEEEYLNHKVFQNTRFGKI